MSTISKPYILNRETAELARANGLDLRKMISDGIKSLSPEEMKEIRLKKQDVVYSSVRVDDEDMDFIRANKLPFFATFEYLVNKSLSN